jgi:hypothetical protein
MDRLTASTEIKNILQSLHDSLNCLPFKPSSERHVPASQPSSFEIGRRQTERAQALRARQADAGARPVEGRAESDGTAKDEAAGIVRRGRVVIVIGYWLFAGRCRR